MGLGLQHRYYYPSRIVENYHNVITTKLSLNWGPFKILIVGPFSATAPDGRPPGDKLLFFDLFSNLFGPAAMLGVTGARCKP